MFKRTRYQNGSLRLKIRANGAKVWQLRYYEAGNRKHVEVGSLSELPTESAARKSAKVQALLLGANAENPLVNSEVKMGTLIARYEQEEMAERYSTGSAYKSYLQCHIKPRWDDTLLRNVKPMAVESWLKGLPLAPKTRMHIRQLMHVMFKCAMRWELTDKNPIALVRVRGGSKRQARPRILEVKEFGRLVATLGEPYKTMVILAGCLGLRVSEMMALQWADFNFKYATLLVQRGIVHGRVGSVKTEYSKDYLPLDPLLIEVLLRYRERCHPTAEGWLFANPMTGKPYHQEQIVKTRLKKAAIAAGIDGVVGWHTFRHSYRSWMDTTGAPLTTQQELMRHASVTTTMNVYGRAMSDDKRNAHGKVVQMILPDNLQRAANGA